MTATSSDIYLLEVIGQNSLTILATVVPLTFCYGLALLLFILSASILIKRGLNRRPTLSLFILIVISFVLFTIAWICQLAYAVIYIRTSHLEVTVQSFNAETVANFGILQYQFNRVGNPASRLMVNSPHIKLSPPLTSVH
ncbi:hypothetical protein H0H92_007165 [Tricholoma furcatifolium]|nr:hypothetical protein H0H92_007165 [Tricholoma furcatifolium]